MGGLGGGLVGGEGGWVSSAPPAIDTSLYSGQDNVISTVRTLDRPYARSLYVV